MKRAINGGKPYWFFVHRDVVFARQLLGKLSCRDANGEKCGDVKVEKNSVFDERSLDVYNYVLKGGQPITLRTGNWAQEFYRLDDALTYVATQFSDVAFVKEILESKRKEGL